MAGAAALAAAEKTNRVAEKEKEKARLRREKQRQQEKAAAAAEMAENARRAAAVKAQQGKDRLLKAAELVAEAEAAKAAAQGAERAAALSAEKARRAAEAALAAKAKAEAEAAAEAAASAATAAKAKQQAAAAAVPPPGSPPREKIATSGALSMLPAKNEVENSQQSLLRALTGLRPPPKPKKKKKGGPCDKCDGNHHADDCPHYQKKRDKHHDAWDEYNAVAGGGVGGGGVGGGGGGPIIVKDATVIPQPGDGSCLFHSLNHGLPASAAGGGSVTELRRTVADYVAANPSKLIGGTPIKDWVLWDSGLSPSDYAASSRNQLRVVPTRRSARGTLMGCFVPLRRRGWEG